MMLGGVAPPVPPVPPPPPALQAARCACLVQLGAALTFAEATPAMPTRGMLTTTVSATNRARRLLRTFIGFLLLVDGVVGGRPTSRGGRSSLSLAAHLVATTYSAFSKVTRLSDIATFRDIPVTGCAQTDFSTDEVMPCFRRVNAECLLLISQCDRPGANWVTQSGSPKVTSPGVVPVRMPS